MTLTTSNFAEAISGTSPSRAATVATSAPSLFVSPSSSLKPSATEPPCSSTVVFTPSSSAGTVQSSTQQIHPGKSFVDPCFGLSTTTSSTQDNSVIVSTSILQSTLTQVTTLLHAQLMATASVQCKPMAESLPIDIGDTDSTRESSVLKKKDKAILYKSVIEKSQPSKSEADSSRARVEDSRNSLLRQLLQHSDTSAESSGSNLKLMLSFPNVPSLEVQLVRSVSPTPSSLLPSLLNEIQSTPKLNASVATTVTTVSIAPTMQQPLSRESSFLSQIQNTSAKVEATMSTLAASASLLLANLMKSIVNPPENLTMKMAAPTTIPANTIAQDFVTFTAPPVQKPKVTSSLPISSTERSPIQQEVITTAPDQAKSDVEAINSRIIPTSQQPVVIQQMLALAEKHPSQQQQLQRQQLQKQQKQQQQQSQSQLLQQLQKSPIVGNNANIIPLTPVESRSETPSQTLHQASLMMSQVLHHKSVLLATQRSPSTNAVSSANASQEHINLMQPSVLQPTAQMMNLSTQLPQGTITEYSVHSADIKTGIHDEVLSSDASVQFNDTKKFLSADKELISSDIDYKTDLKKLKKPQYQKKRRNIQKKDACYVPQKKKSRKMSCTEDDYDTFIDNLMVKLQQLTPMKISEPVLGTNYNICPIYSSGNLVKFGGNNTKEFSLLKFNNSDKKGEKCKIERDIDTPTSIISTSSPECVIPEPMHHFPGLKLIDDDSDEESYLLKRLSPVIPIVSPIPIRLKPGNIKDMEKFDEENLGITNLNKSSTSLTEKENVTIKLTLNSQAADNIMGVFEGLDTILNNSLSTGYKVVERTIISPNSTLGLYRIKGNDGKEGLPIDIQNILNSAAKFCHHCDVVILNSLIRKKVSELPFLIKEEAQSGDELCFCSEACYTRFALMPRTHTCIYDKAAIVDDLCQKFNSECLGDELLNRVQKNSNHLLTKQSIGKSKAMEMDSIEVYLCNKITSEENYRKLQNTRDNFTINKRLRKCSAEETRDFTEGSLKVCKGLRYKFWTAGSMHPTTKSKKPTDRKMTENLFRAGITNTLPSNTADNRRCIFCQNIGDGAADGTGRLLNFDVDNWMHLNCVLWSEEVYETVNGALINVDVAVLSAKNRTCILCQQTGATIKCFKKRCNSFYHFRCAVSDGCIFFKNKSTYCSQHVPKNKKDNELAMLSVPRQVYINRDENKQVATLMHQSDHTSLLRVGSLILLSVGNLLPHQLANFHTSNYIYPVGYKIVRFYWSMRHLNKRCRYICSIHDVSDRPEFRVLIQEPEQEDIELRDASPQAVWNRILEPLSKLRKENNVVHLFSRYVTGEYLFGLTEPAVVRILESLPGIENLTNYQFKYGRNSLLSSSIEKTTYLN